jgi:hypothetical protein
MEASAVSRAVAAATSIAEELGLPVEDASVLCNSNKLALHLLPCDVFARVAPAGHGLAQFEVTLWTYYQPVTVPHFTERVADGRSGPNPKGCS